MFFITKPEAEMHSPIRFFFALTFLFCSTLSMWGNSSSLKNLNTRNPERAFTPFTDMQKLTPIDRDTIGEAYPWLSPDGLRLYYTVCGGSGGFHLKTRASLGESFDNDKELNVSPAGERALSVWLTDDELTIYYVVESYDGPMSTALYRADRYDPAGEFGEPVQIELTGEMTGFLSGPSLSKDGNFLYMYNDDDAEGHRIIEFERIGENAYRAHDSFVAPEGMQRVLPGQLSRDNLRYYCALEREGDDSSLLGYYYRESIEEPFRTFAFLESESDGDTLKGYHPTFSGDESVMVFVSDNSDTWENNRLYMMGRQVSSVDAAPIRTTEEKASLSLYPNPTGDRLHIDLQNSSSVEGVVAIFADNGDQMRRISIGDGNPHIEIDISDLPSGPYYCRLETDGKVSEPRRFVVAK